MIIKRNLEDFKDLLKSEDYTTRQMGWIMFMNSMHLKYCTYSELIKLNHELRWGEFWNQNIIKKLNKEFQRRQSIANKTKK